MPDEKDEKPQASRRGFFGTIAAAFGGAAAAKALPPVPPPEVAAPITVTLPASVPPAMRYAVKHVPWPTSCVAYSAVMPLNGTYTLKIVNHAKTRTEPE